jgi:hypothetical protein
MDRAVSAQNAGESIQNGPEHHKSLIPKTVSRKFEIVRTMYVLGMWF